MFQYVFSQFQFSKVTNFLKIIFQIITETEQIPYTKEAPTPYNTQLDCLVVFLKHRLKTAVTVEIKPLSGAVAKSKDPIVSSLLKKLCFIYGINAVPKLKTNNS